MYSGNTLDEMLGYFVDNKITFGELKEYMLDNDFDMSDIDVNSLFALRAINKAKKKGVIQNVN